MIAFIQIYNLLGHFALLLAVNGVVVTSLPWGGQTCPLFCLNSIYELSRHHLSTLVLYSGIIILASLLANSKQYSPGKNTDRGKH